MNDLERRLRAEFSRQAMPTLDPAATERFALSLVGSRGRVNRQDLANTQDATRNRRRRWWLIPAVAAVVLIVPVLTIVLLHRNRSVAPAGSTTDPKAIVGIEWLLTRSVDADGVSHPAPTGTAEQVLQLDGKGGIGFNQDCNYASGRVSLSAGRLTTSQVMTTAEGCGSGNDAMGLLGGGKVSWFVDQHVLTIIGSGDRKLIFVVRPSIYPLDYPGSPNVTLLKGTIGTADYRVSYVRNSAQQVYVFLEARDAPGASWSQYDLHELIGWAGPQPDAGRGACSTLPTPGGKYLVGLATARAARVTVQDSAGKNPSVKLYPLPGTGGLQAYAGFLGAPGAGSTLSVLDASGQPLGLPCTLR